MYTVSWVGSGLDEARKLRDAARRLGQKKQLKEQMLYIVAALQTRPLEWGEASRTHGDLIHCHGFHERLAVTYGVHDTTKTVFVKSIRTLPGHPLHDAKPLE